MTDDGRRLYQYSVVLAGLLLTAGGVWGLATDPHGTAWVYATCCAAAFTAQSFLRYFAPNASLEYAIGESVMATLAELPPGASVQVTSTEIIPDYPPREDDYRDS